MKFLVYKLNFFILIKKSKEEIMNYKLLAFLIIGIYAVEYSEFME